jgi:DNA primase catalytic core
MSRTKDYEQARKELKGFLRQFLEDSGIKGKNGKYICINPDHDDKFPSMGVLKNTDGSQVYHCFSGGCNISGDIFSANNIINGAPMVGYEFVTQNLKPLCDKYGIDFEPRPMTKEEIELMNMKSVLQIVKDIIQSNLVNHKPEDSIVAYMESKRLNRKEHVIQYGLGSVKSWDFLVSELHKRGIDDNLIKKSGIEPFLFNANNLIFVVSDEYSNARGFAARNCLYTPEDNSVKYYNSRNNLLYNKSTIMYNLNRAVKKNVDIHNSLYIVEGYTDAIALDMEMLRSASLGGTAFTEEHISLLQKMGITDIVFLLDGDSAGKKATGSAITKVMEGIRNFRTRIVELPESEDPDTFLRKFGKNALHDLPHLTTYDWRLRELKDKTDLTRHEIAKEIIPLIVNERSYIERDRMADKLSEITDIPIETIRRELFAIAEDKKLKVKAEKESIIDNTVKKLKMNPDDALIILNDSYKSIFNVSERNNEMIYDEKECFESVRSLEVFQESEENKSSLFFRRMPKFEQQLNGTISSKLLLLGGQPNAGKTSFVLNTIVNILLSDYGDSKYNQNQHDTDRYNNVTILLQTIDDSRQDTATRIVTILAWEMFKQATINLIAAPYKFRASAQLVSEFNAARKKAYSMLLEWIRNGRLIIKDSTHGATLSSAVMMLEMYKQKFAGRKLLYFLDNLYDLKDFPGNDEIKRLQDLSRALKEITNQIDITTLSTVEYRKGGEGQKGWQSLNETISGPKTLEYDANWVGHLLNDMNANSESEMYFSEKSYSDWNVPKEERLPIITLRIGKNKITEFKGDIHYYFIPKRALFFEMHENNLGLVRPSVKQILEPLYISKLRLAGNYEEVV